MKAFANWLGGLVAVIATGIGFVVMIVVGVGLLVGVVDGCRDRRPEETIRRAAEPIPGDAFGDRLPHEVDERVKFELPADYPKARYPARKAGGR